MKNNELLRHEKMSPHKWVPHNSLKSRSKFTPPKSNNRSELNPLVFVFLLCLPLCLSGCMGIYEGGFECPPGKGVGCKSISDVNQMVDQGDLPERPLADLSQSRCKNCGASQNQEIDPKPHEKPKIWYPPLNLEEV